MMAYDPTTKKSSVLTGDSTARNIQSQLSSLIQSSVTGVTGGITRMSDIGITVQKGGTLAVNSSKLTAALTDPDKDVASLFTQTTTGNKGIAVRFNDLLESLVGTDGLIPSRTEGINTSIKNVQKRAESLNRRLTSIESRYRAQFTALDTLISSMQQTSSFLTQQLANMSTTSSS
jgi:flagellar hook-associated protein 2